MEPQDQAASPAPASLPAWPGTTGELFGYKPASMLTLQDAFEFGFRIILKWSFMFPVLVVTVLVNALAEVAARPLVPSLLRFNQLSPAEVERIIMGGLVVLAITLVGGFIANVYAYVWALAATSGPLPTTDQALRLAARRLIGVVGTGIVAFLVSLAVLLPAVAAFALGAQVNPALGVLAALASSALWLWLWGRISMALWLAAEGASIAESIAGSWRMTKGQLLRILGWSFLFGIVAGLLTSVLGAVFGILPYTGGGVAQGIGAAITTGAGVTLFRRVQAAASSVAAPPAAAASGG